MAVTSPRHATATASAQTTAHRVHRGGPGAQHVPSYAGFVTRAIAVAIDAAAVNAVAVVTAGAVALVASLLREGRPAGGAAALIGGIAFTVWVVGYFVAFWSTTGQTPGNRVMRIRVARADGSRLRPRHGLVRLLGIVLSVPLLAGFVPILVTERRRGLHDWMAGTVVRLVPPPDGSRR